MSKICPSCKQELADDARFCNNCGAQQPANGQQAGPSQGARPSGSEVFTVEDVERNKVISALAYFIFFLPLIAAQDSPFGRFHANQGLLLLILSVGGNTILGMIPIIGWALVPFFSLFCLALMIMGLVNTLNGKARELPLIGQYRIIR